MQESSLTCRGLKFNHLLLLILTMMIYIIHSVGAEEPELRQYGSANSLQELQILKADRLVGLSGVAKYQETQIDFHAYADRKAEIAEVMITALDGTIVASMEADGIDLPNVTLGGVLITGHDGFTSHQLTAIAGVRRSAEGLAFGALVRDLAKSGLVDELDVEFAGLDLLYSFLTVFAEGPDGIYESRYFGNPAAPVDPTDQRSRLPLELYKSAGGGYCTGDQWWGYGDPSCGIPYADAYLCDPPKNECVGRCGRGCFPKDFYLGNCWKCACLRHDLGCGSFGAAIYSFLGKGSCNSRNLLWGCDLSNLNCPTPDQFCGGSTFNDGGWQQYSCDAWIFNEIWVTNCEEVYDQEELYCDWLFDPFDYEAEQEYFECMEELDFCHYACTQPDSQF